MDEQAGVSLAFPLPVYILAEVCLVAFHIPHPIHPGGLWQPSPIPAVPDSFFVFLLDRLSLLPHLLCFLSMSELNQEHLVHVRVLF